MECNTAAARTVISKYTWVQIGKPKLMVKKNLGIYPFFTIKMLGQAKIQLGSQE